MPAQLLALYKFHAKVNKIIRILLEKDILELYLHRVRCFFLFFCMFFVCFSLFVFFCIIFRIFDLHNK